MLRENKERLVIRTATELGKLLIDYLAGGLFAGFISVVTLGWVFLAVGSKYEALLFKIIAFTPTLDLRGKSDFELGLPEIVKLYAFWALVFQFLGYLWRWWGKKNLSLKKILTVVLGLYHLLFFWVGMKLGSELPQMRGVMLFFYGFGLVCGCGYFILKKEQKRLDGFLVKYQF